MFASLRRNHQLLLQSRAGAETLPSPPQPSRREAVRVTSLGRGMHTLANGREAGMVEEAAVVHGRAAGRRAGPEDRAARAPPGQQIGTLIPIRVACLETSRTGVSGPGLEQPLIAAKTAEGTRKAQVPTFLRPSLVVRRGLSCPRWKK